MKYGLMQFNNNGTHGIWAVEVYTITNGQVTFKVGTITKRGSYPNIHRVFDVRDSDLVTLPVTDCVFVEGDVYNGRWVTETKQRLRDAA